MDFNQKPREDEATSWLWVGLWLLLIYVTIPLARPIQEAIRDRGGKAVFLWVTFLAFALAGVWIVKSVRTGKVTLSLRQVFTLVFIGGLFSWLTWSMRANPEEAIHFIQYGVLSILLYRAFSHRLADPSIYFAAAMLGVVFGFVDELIQWIVPRRHFAFRDIGINVIAVTLVQAAICFGLQPAMIRGSVRARGLRYGFTAGAVMMLLFLFAVSNTDGFKAWYTTFIPKAKAVNEVTVEYGYRIEDETIGVFYSRLPVKEILNQDHTRSEEVAEILKQYRSERAYGSFMNTYPAYDDPFLVEARVHLFRRDRYAGLAVQNVDNEKQVLENARIAYRENQILEKYFGETLRRSDFMWPEHIRNMITQFCANSPPYHSAVSSSLITRVTRPVLIGICASLFILMIAGERWAARRCT